jgi:predicted double-glycine peptidase
MDDTDNLDAGYDAGHDDDLAQPFEPDPPFEPYDPVAAEPDELLHAGHHQNWQYSWDQQTLIQSCGPACVAQIVEFFTGYDYPDRSFVDAAVNQGTYGQRGMITDALPGLFQQANITATSYTTGNMDFVSSELDKGNGVIALVDITEYDGHAAPSYQDGMVQGHFVVVTEVDPVTQTVYISDPYYGQVQMSVSQFAAAWQDAGNSMVVAQAPATGNVQLPVQPSTNPIYNPNQMPY